MSHVITGIPFEAIYRIRIDAYAGVEGIGGCKDNGIYS
jgi:hypothetical protein